MFSNMFSGKKPKEEAEKVPEPSEPPPDFMQLAIGSGVSSSSDSDGSGGENESLGLGNEDENSLDSGDGHMSEEQSIASLAYHDPELNEHHINYSIEYFDCDSAVASRYYYRKDDDLYREACGREYTVSLYPFMPAKKDGLYRVPMMRLARKIKAVQVRRLVLMDEINATAQEVRKFDDLNALCDKKLAAKEQRTIALEEEMDHAMKFDDSKPTSRFNAALGTKIIWNALTTFLQKEFKHLEFLESHPEEHAKKLSSKGDALEQAHASDDKNHDEHTGHLNLGDVKYIWDLMQTWLLVRGLEARCRLGPGGYPNREIMERLRSMSGSTTSSMMSGIMSDRSAKNSDAGDVNESVEDRRNRLRHTMLQGRTNVLVTLIPTSDLKNQYPTWKQVVRWTGASTDSIYSVCHAVADMLERTPLADILSPISLNDFAAGLRELKPDEKVNELMAAATVRITDDIGHALEERVLHALREYIHWRPELEKLRKDRFKRLGMKYVAHADGEVDVDVHGAIRIIPNADDVVDTDLLHGYTARLDVHMVKPAIQAKVDAIMERKKEQQKELMAVQQWGYEQTAPYLQRIFRGVLGRMFRNRVRTDYVYQAQHAAATLISMWLKMKKTETMMAETLAQAMIDLHSRQIVGIQKNVRRFIKYRPYKRIREAKHKQFIHHTVARFQAMVRGFFARRRVTEMQGSLKEQQEKEIKAWAIVSMQKLARGYIARNTLVKSMKIRSSLSKDVLAMAEKFLKRGNLWEFLRDVDGKFRRLNNELVEIEQREDEMASTFVEKVIQGRQGDFDGAWDQFGKVLRAEGGGREEGATQQQMLTGLHPSGSPSMGRKPLGGGGGGGDGRNDDASLATLSTKETGIKGKLNKKIKVRKLKETESAVPGPMLRRAVTSTVKRGLDDERERMRKGEKFTDRLMEEFQEAYGPGQESAAVVPSGGGAKKGKKKGSSKKAGGGGGRGDGGGKSDSSTVTSALDAAVASKERKSLTYNPADEVKIATGISNTQKDWVKSAPKAAGFKGRGRPGEDRSKVLPGQSYMTDIPKGIDDSVEMLMRAAALRMYKPEFFAGTSEESYKMYLQLPQGLSKVRYESEAWRACEKFTNALRNKGFKMIKDMLPFSKFGMFMSGVGVPPDLIARTSDIVRELILMDNALKGTGHKVSMEESDQILNETGRVSNALDAKFIIKKKREENKRYGIEDDNEYEDILAEESVLEQEMKLLKPVEYDETLPSRFLDELVERGEWSNVAAKVDDLLLHAAFMIVPYQHIDSMTGEETVTPMGHYAFREFTAALQRFETDKERREATRSRFRAALLMSTPYALSLKADGIQTVKELIKVNLPDLNMPSVYMEQVESFLLTCVGDAVEAKIAPMLKDHKKPNDTKTPFAVPMSFDPKFQRGPLDWKGRPMRLGPIKDSMKMKSKADRNREAEEREATRQIPPGLWDYKAPPTNEQAVPALWTFNATGGPAKVVAKPPPPKPATPSIAESMMLESGLKDPPPSPIKREKSDFVSHAFAMKKRTQKNMKEFLERKALNPLKHDFETHVRRGFKRPYVCSVPGCGQAFSRIYTLRVHERSHDLYPRYHTYKREAALGYDPNVADMAQDAKVRAAMQHQLPPIAQQKVDGLRTAASQRSDLDTSELDAGTSFMTMEMGTGMGSEGYGHLSRGMGAATMPPGSAPGFRRMSPHAGMARPPSVGAGSTVVSPATGRFTAPGSSSLGPLDGVDYSTFPHDAPPLSIPLEQEVNVDDAREGVDALYEQIASQSQVGGLDGFSLSMSLGSLAEGGDSRDNGDAFASGGAYPNPFDEPLPGMDQHNSYPSTHFEPVSVG